MPSPRTPLVVATFALVAACRYDWPEAASTAPLVDAGHDTGRDASLAPFDCVGALACDTFDDGPLTAHWSDSYLSPGGELRIETSSNAPSPPSVLLASRPASSAPPATAYVTKVATQSLRRASVTFKLRPEVLDGARRACVAGIVFGDGGPNEHLVRLLVGDGRAAVQEKAPALQVYDLSRAPALGAWSTMSLSVEVGGRIVVHLDNDTVLDVTVDPSWAVSDSTRVFVGINFVESPANALSFHFDDVRFDGS